MKIAIFGLTITSSWGNGHATPYRAILQALHRRGHSVTFFEKDVPYYALRRDFSSCDFCELVLYSAWDEVRARALAACAESDAVIVASFCPGGARISDELFHLSRPLRVFYDLDTPVTLQRLAAGDLDYLRRDQVGEFDLYLSFTGGRVLQQLERRWGARRARALYGCVDPDLYRPVPPQPEYACALGYMGTYSAGRQPKLEEFFVEPARQRPHERFVLAGALYPWQWTWPPNVQRLDHVPPPAHPAFYSSSRLTLNITRQEMAAAGHCPSGRFFEAAACGAPIVSDGWPGLESFFEDGREIFVVEKTEDVIALLQLPAPELARVAARARERTLDEYTGERRAQELLGYFAEAARSAPGQPVCQPRAGQVEVAP